jgi:alpha-1,2-mannosyltransferase
VGVLAFAVRLLSLLHSGGFHSLLGYDEGVYYGASTAFVDGLMPYRDFVLVHPPGSVVLLAPFALLGRVTSDTTGWAVARLAVMSLGALNAALVLVIGRRVSLAAGLVAGGLYAVWAPVVHVERTTMLEAVVLAGIVVALWAVREPREATWRLVLAGAALGLGTSTKLWGAAPLAVLVGWLLVSRSWRQAAIVTGASVVAFAAVVLPFLAVARGRLVDLVVLAQLGRGPGGIPEADRPARMLGVDLAAFAHSPRLLTGVGTASLLVVLLAMAATCLRPTVPAGRLWVALLAVQVLVLLVVPVYFDGYSSFIAPALLLVLGAAAAQVWARLDWRSGPGAAAVRILAAAVVAVGIAASGLHAARSPVDLAPHLAAVDRYARPAHCVGSDSAGLLILADTLTRDIERGCATVVDFDGTIYAMADGSNPGRLGSHARREESTAYQAMMRDYFDSHDVLLLHRTPADGLDARTRAALAARPLLHHEPGLHVRG